MTVPQTHLIQHWLALNTNQTYFFDIIKSTSLMRGSEYEDFELRKEEQRVTQHS